MENKIIPIVSLGISLNWLSLFFSYSRLPNFYQGDINQPIATGGFPLKIFEYPVPPMGSDWPPISAWPMFILNLIIWLFVAWLISRVLGKKMENRKVMAIFIISAIVLSILGLLYIMFKFD